jgi:nucleoside 2-deoxyribosyltransferase
MPRVPKFYIAGPFFNEPQIEVIRRIEEMMIQHDVPFFSPRLQPANQPGKITNEMAAEIFKNNVENLYDCDRVLAVLDWTLPPNVGMYVLRDADDHLAGHRVISGEYLAGPVILPDTGTVFEMGFAHSESTPIYGFTLRPPEAPLNVMLTQSCQGILRQWGQLAEFLNHGDIKPEIAKPWQGRNQ